MGVLTTIFGSTPIFLTKLFPPPTKRTSRLQVSKRQEADAESEAGGKKEKPKKKGRDGPNLELGGLDLVGKISPAQKVTN